MPPETKKSIWREPLIVFGRMSGWVIAPIVVALFVGKWLDRKYGTGNLLFIIATAVSFAISIFGIICETKKYLKAIDKKDNAGGN